MRKRKATKETEATRGKHLHHGRGSHHRLTMEDTTTRGVPYGQAVMGFGSGWLHCFPNCVLVHVLVHGFCLCWVILDLFCYFLRSSRPSKTSSNLVIYACKLEFYKTLKKSKITHNGRNRGTNRTAIHFNPLK